MNRIKGYELRIKGYVKKYFGITIIFILGLLPLHGLLHSGLPITHDGMDHVARIANFYQGLSEGTVFPRWAENLNWGYGHPILMFLYPLSSYLASFFHFLGISYIDSIKLVFGIGYIASGISMYLWAREQFNEYFGVASAILYLYSPYRFIDMYVRGAIGEHMAFIFPPLILYFILKYFKSNKLPNDNFYIIGIGISLCLLLLAHNAISLMFLPFFGAYALHLSITTHQSKKLLLSLISIILGILLSSFFSFPAFFEGKFTLRDIVTGYEYKSRFVTNPFTFLYSGWNYGITGQFSVQIGIANLLGIMFVPILFIKRKKSNFKLLFLILTFFFILSIFLMLPQSNFLYENVTTLKKFQFPWRFLTLTVFTSALLGGSIFILIRNGKKNIFILSILICILLATTFTYWNPKGYIQKPDSFYDGIYDGTTDTGESSPIWSVRFMEHRPKDSAEVIDGEALIEEIERKSTMHIYRISVTSDRARIRENTLYFPNWKVLVDGKEVEVQFQDPSERGLITFNLPKGEHKIEVIFKDTKLRIVSNLISLFSLTAIIIIGLHAFIRAKK